MSAFFGQNYFRPKYFNAAYLHGSGEEEPARSGVWRLQLYKLQEESLRKDKEKRDTEIANAVEKVVGAKPIKPAPAKKAKKVSTKLQYATKPPVAVKPMLRQEPSISERTLPLVNQVWSIISETYWLSVSSYPIQKSLLAQIDEAANDEDDVEMLLLAA